MNQDPKPIAKVRVASKRHDDIRASVSMRTYLDGSIERCRSKRVGVLRVEDHHHGIVSVAFKDLHTLPTLVPVPQLDEHVVRGRQHVRLRRVDGKATDVIRMALEGLDLLHRVVVVDTNVHVISCRDNPLLSRDELGTTD